MPRTTVVESDGHRNHVCDDVRGHLAPTHGARAACLRVGRGRRRGSRHGL